ncbi:MULTISPECIES: response regulator transcription factor [Streptomyces]|uniref:Response regulator transcription factor n=2 Tax=Streptomyces TaxID=1883 RepID=A0ABV9J7C6_9ACTN
MPRSASTLTVRVAIHAPDAVIRVGLANHLQFDRRITEVPPSSTGEADVTVVAVDSADAGTLDVLAALSDRGDSRFVLVVGRQWQTNIFTAVDRGVRAVLWRDSFTPAAFVRALITVAEGGGSFPPALQGVLMEQVQWTHRKVLTPHGLTASGVTPREADVLRLIADGKELSEIAELLSYSERTIKYILSGLMKRLELRNRAHAVAHAIRSGLI